MDDGPKFCRDCVFFVRGDAHNGERYLHNCHHPGNGSADIVTGKFYTIKSAGVLRTDGPCGEAGAWWKPPLPPLVENPPPINKPGPGPLLRPAKNADDEWPPATWPTSKPPPLWQRLWRWVTGG